MRNFYSDLLELLEVSRITRPVGNGEEGSRNAWKLVARTDRNQRLEFDVEAESLRALLPAGNRGDRKNSMAGRRYLTSVARLTLIWVFYKEHSGGDLEVLDWWEAREDETAKWGTGTKPKQIW